MTDQEIREFARREVQIPGEIEIDDDAKVGRGDDRTAWVQAWIYFDLPDDDK